MKAMKTRKPPIKIVRELSWRAVRRGRVYCSPACGAGCTHAAYLKATRKALALAKRMGPGWAPRVSENMGWHYRADHDVCVVYEYEKGVRYVVFVNTQPQFIVRGVDPVLAFQQAMRQLHAYILDLQAVEARIRST